MLQDYGVSMKVYVQVPLKDSSGYATFEGTYGVVVDANSPHEALQIAEDKMRSSFASESGAFIEVLYFEVGHP